MIPFSFDLMRLGLDGDVRVPGTRTSELRHVLDTVRIGSDMKAEAIGRLLNALVMRQYRTTDERGSYDLFVVWDRGNPTLPTLARVGATIPGAGYQECYIVTTMHDLLRGRTIHSTFETAL